MGELRMPSLGADMDAGTLVAWQVEPGAHVHRGDVVALVETEKGVIEVEIWQNGTIDALLVGRGTKVPVGTVLATVKDDDGGTVAVPPVEPGRVRASPAARQLARERGVDLASVRGTGPHGAVTRDDIEKAAAPAPKPAPAAPPKAAAAPPVVTPAAPAVPTPTFDAAGMRRAIAAAMARSKREIPHYYLSADLDVGRTVRWLAEENARRGVSERVVLAAVLLKATALALRDVPELNGTFEEGAFRPGNGIHLGVAIALRGGGLVAPALHDADRLTLVALMMALSDVVGRARAGTLKSSEMSDATITVTNLGDLGTDQVFGVITPPQVALVGFGTPRECPWAEDGMLGVRPVVTATLSADHRVSDGHRGARFLAAVRRLVSRPEEL